LQGTPASLGSEVMAACREARHAAQRLAPQVRVDIGFLDWDFDPEDSYPDDHYPEDGYPEDGYPEDLFPSETNWVAGVGVILRGVEDVCFGCGCLDYRFRSTVDAAAIFHATREFLGADIKRVAFGPEESCSVNIFDPRTLRDREFLVSERACGRAVAFPLGWNGTLWDRLAVMFPSLAAEVERDHPQSSPTDPDIQWDDIESTTLLSDRSARSYGSGSRWQLWDGSDEDSTSCVDREAIRVYLDGTWEIMRVETAALWANFCPDITTFRLLRLVAVEAAKVWPKLQYVSVNVSFVTSDIVDKAYKRSRSTRRR
jgi:hypothetical protein